MAASVTGGRLGLRSQEGRRKGGTARVGGWGGGHPALLPRKAGFPGNELERPSGAVCHSTASCQHARPAAPGFLARGLLSVIIGRAGTPPQGSQHKAGVWRGDAKDGARCVEAGRSEIRAETSGNWRPALSPSILSYASCQGRDRNG